MRRHARHGVRKLVLEPNGVCDRAFRGGGRGGCGGRLHGRLPRLHRRGGEERQNRPDGRRIPRVSGLFASGRDCRGRGRHHLVQPRLLFRRMRPARMPRAEHRAVPLPADRRGNFKVGRRGCFCRPQPVYGLRNLHGGGQRAVFCRQHPVPHAGKGIPREPPRGHSRLFRQPRGTRARIHQQRGHSCRLRGGGSADPLGAGDGRLSEKAEQRPLFHSERRAPRPRRDGEALPRPRRRARRQGGRPADRHGVAGRFARRKIPPGGRGLGPQGPRHGPRPRRRPGRRDAGGGYIRIFRRALERRRKTGQGPHPRVRRDPLRRYEGERHGPRDGAPVFRPGLHRRRRGDLERRVQEPGAAGLYRGGPGAHPRGAAD